MLGILFHFPFQFGWIFRVPWGFSRVVRSCSEGIFFQPVKAFQAAFPPLFQVGEIRKAAVHSGGQCSKLSSFFEKVGIFCWLRSKKKQHGCMSTQKIYNDMLYICNYMYMYDIYLFIDITYITYIMIFTYLPMCIYIYCLRTIYSPKSKIVGEW